MSKLVTSIEALDLLSQLGRETIVEYLAENRAITDIVDDLLALQISTPELEKIEKGTISDSIKNLTRSIQVSGDTILRALLRLRETVGGYIEVDNDRKLNWLDSIEQEREGQQIRYRKNLKGIEREIDYSQLFNRIRAYGAGEGDARIELPAPGYVEDEAKQTEWGGIYPRTIVDKSITSPDTLLAYALLYLDNHKDPPISYRIDAVDLSKSEEIDFSFEALQLGSQITIIDEDIGINVPVIVVRIGHPDLLHPDQMTLELANRTKDITDTLAEVYDGQQLRDHIATKIGAGQVVISGEVTIKNWLSGETTNIKGDVIRTGKIESNNWGEGAGSQFNLDDGVFKLGGSSSPKLSWNGTTLGISGVIIFEAGSEADYGYITGDKPPADAEANPDYIRSTYISSTEIESPEISGTTGYFSGTFKVGSAGIVIDGVNKLIKSSNYSAGSAGWQIENTGDAEFNDVIVRGAVYATSGEFTGTLKTSNIDGGKTLTVNGTISAGGGSVVINSSGVKIIGQYLDFYYGATRKGYVWADSAGFRVSAVSGHPLTLDAPGSGNKIILNSESVILPQKTSAPSALDGKLVYDPSDGYMKYYSEFDSSWFRIQRTGGWG